MHPIFIHIMSTGAIWQSLDPAFTPSGTVLATFRVCSLAATQQIGTLSGNSGSYSCSGSTGKYGKEIT